tara:strand:- start:719 stop:883 length:165 start_codon:yes stop_codon:yes gene_type:complete
MTKKELAEWLATVSSNSPKFLATPYEKVVEHFMKNYTKAELNDEMNSYYGGCAE